MSDSSHRDADRVLTAAARLADVLLFITALFFLIQLGFAFQLHRPLVFKLAFAAIVLVAIALRRASPTLRTNCALAILPCVAGLMSYEAYAAWRRPRDATAAWLAGRSFDSRGFWETVEDERRKEPSTVSYVIPRALLTHHLVLKHWEPESVAHTVKPDWGLMIDGVRTLPLSGISNRPTVFSNESGTRVIYDSDEQGFNNPRGIWGSGDLQVAIIGDSFSHGAGVMPDEMTAAHLRRRYPRTLTLGMSANGPLMEYATLKEYVTDLKPPIVLWVYYLNDLSDMEVEKQAPMLLRYLEEDDFRQGLIDKRAKLDEALEVYLRDVERRAPQAWPKALSEIGISRLRTPLWLQDLITTEQHSSLAAFLRLDGACWIITKKLLEANYFEQPPDYALFERILAKARDTVRSWGGQLYFVYLPALHHLGPRHPVVFSRAEVLQLVAQLGIPLIDVHQTFVDTPGADRLRFHYESHANEAGYALHAKVILDALDAAAASAAARAGS